MYNILGLINSYNQVIKTEKGCTASEVRVMSEGGDKGPGEERSANGGEGKFERVQSHGIKWLAVG